MTNPILQTHPTSVYFWNSEAYHSGKYNLIINQGSTGSSKTFSILQLLITIALAEKKDIQIMGPSSKRLGRGALKDFIKIMHEMDLWKDIDWHDTKSRATFKTGVTIEFFPLDDPDIARGPRRQIGFINEANLVPEAVYVQLRMRTKEVMFLDFNPADNFCYIYPLIDAKNPKTCYIHSTYRDNQYCAPDVIEYVNSLSPDMFRVYA